MHTVALLDFKALGSGICWGDAQEVAGFFGHFLSKNGPSGSIFSMTTVHVLGALMIMHFLPASDLHMGCVRSAACVLLNVDAEENT
jgi:hypothetical protein